MPKSLTDTNPRQLPPLAVRRLKVDDNETPYDAIARELGTLFPRYRITAIAPATLKYSTLTVSEYVVVAELRTADDAAILDQIFHLMSGKEWSPETLDQIAGIFAEANRPLADV